MRIMCLILFIISFCTPAKSQVPDFQWAKSFGGLMGDGGYTTVSDVTGNIYVMGIFSLTADMDPGPGVYNLTSAGSSDIYISKFDPAGNFVWSRQIGNSLGDLSRTMSIDNLGNIFLTGHYQATVDFDPGPSVFNMTCSTTGYAAFLLKLDGGGNFIWAKELIESDYGNSGWAITPVPSGNVYVAGKFQGTGDFDPGPAVFTLTSTAGVEDVFISKFDGSGNFIWAKQFAGNEGKSCYSMVSDPLENIYLTGIFYGTCDFDPGTATFNLTANNTNGPSLTDAYITKLDLNGNFIFAKQVSGEGDDVGWDMAVDQTGAIFVTGEFSGVTDFDPGPGTFFLNAAPLPDAFVLKLDNTGNFSWATQFIGVGAPNSNSRSFSIGLDNLGFIYTTGDFVGGVDFDPGATAFVLSTTAIEETYISKLNPAGNFVFALQLATNHYVQPGTLFIDPQKNITLTGVFGNTVDFDPTPGVFNLTTIGTADAFILKLSQSCTQTTTSTLTASACNTYTLNGHTYTSSGTYTQTLVNSAGCDSILTLYLTIGGSITTSNIVACDNYLWEGQTYTSSGAYQVIYTDVSGCDSVLNLNLIINHSVSTNINVTICEGQSYAGYTVAGTYIDTYTAANGCDSIRTLYLSVNPKSISSVNATICEGQSYAGHSSTGIYTDTYIATNGCDSVRTLNLIVNPRKYTSVNVTICQGQTYVAGGAPQTTSGVYRDTLQTYLGCDSVITTNLLVNLKPKPDLGNDKDLCTGSSITFNPGSYSSYVWQDMSVLPTFTTNTTGLYWVIVTDANNCSAADSVMINTIHALPSNFLKPVDSTCTYQKLIIASLTNYNSYLWSTGATSSTITISQPGQYILTVNDFNGCKGSDSILIIQKNCFREIYFPNAFTPNGDTKNDLFKVSVYGTLNSFRLEVYNRYGEIIFVTNDPLKGWDGTYRGKPQPFSVYTWHCTYQLEGKMLTNEKGTVTLLR